MASNVRLRILDGALEILRAEGGGSVTLDAAAKQVGLTKPGLMYHFPTKEALVTAVTEHVGAHWEGLLLDRLGKPLESAPAYERIRAYVEVALAGQFDRADFAVFSDALYRETLTETWTRRFAPWVELPDDLPAADRARLTAARLLADGFWTAAATGVFAVPAADSAALRAVADELLNGGITETPNLNTQWPQEAMKDENPS